MTEAKKELMKEKSKEMRCIPSILGPLTAGQEGVDRLGIIHSVFTKVYSHSVREPWEGEK